MKKYLFSALLASLLFAACEEEEFGPVLKVGTAPALTAPAASTDFVLKEADAANSFAKFTWTAADFGFQAGTSYTLEMDLAGNNFKEPIVLGQVNALELGSKTIGEINNIMLTKGRPADEPSEVEFRVWATISKEVDTLVSQTVKAKITPYPVIIVYPQLQVPGSYQGWKPEDDNTVIFSAKSNEVYEGFIWLTAAAKYKYCKGKSWANNWGDNGNDGSLEKDGADIPIVDEGLYRLKVDLNAFTHEQLKTNWGIIGSATPTGWDSDTDMTYDPVGNKLTVTLDLKAEDIKFRANDDWAVNFGDTGANKSLEYGGDNIKIAEAGNYTVDLILSGAVPTYKLKKN